MNNIKLFDKEEIFIRISKGIPFDRNFKIYSKLQIQYLLHYYQSIEEYEKCQIIKNFIDLRFNHELNYIKK